MSRRNRREAGEIPVGCLFGLVLLVIAAFVAYKVIPVKLKAAEVREVVVDEAKSAGTHSDERIRKAILDIALEQGLPVGDENIQIERTANLIRVNVEYDVPIKFPGKTYNWHIRHHAENPIF